MDAGIRRELHGHKPNARELPGHQRGRQTLAIDPRGADPLERALGPSAHADVRRLEQANPWIEERRRQTPQIGRWIHPHKTSSVVEIAPVPALQADHFQIRTNLALGVVQSGQLANGKEGWAAGSGYADDTQAYPLDLPPLVRPKVKVSGETVLVWTARA